MIVHPESKLLVVTAALEEGAGGPPERIDGR